MLKVTKTKGSEGAGNLVRIKEEFKERCALLKISPEDAAAEKENVPRDTEAHDVRLTMRLYRMTREQFKMKDSVQHLWERVFHIPNSKKPGDPFLLKRVFPLVGYTFLVPKFIYLASM